MSGDDVRLAQQRLVELGYTEVGEIDGYFGPTTESAVIRFQSLNGLTADGMIGPQTWARLFRPETTSAPPLPAASPTSTGLTGHIVFVSYRDRDEEIYNMDADGSNQTRLTQSQYADNEPVFSPDGRFIVFVSQRAGGHKLFVMNADGSNQRQLTDGKSRDEYDPYFSPDGEWIAYSSSRGGRFELWFIRTDGTDIRQLTTGPNAKNLPAWSPDGQWIAYNSVEDGEDVIKVIRPDGSDDKIILRFDEAYVSGWVGGRILFVAEIGSTTDIYSVSPDGTDVRQLTTHPANDKGAFGTWDERFIIFNSARDGNDEIYVMNADGSDQRRTTFSDGNDFMATWGP
jgi:Tol biopolymer transport system component